MMSEFQAVYRQRIGAVFGGPQTCLLIAASEAAVRAMLANDDFAVLSVTPVRAVVDWSKPVFDRDEAAAFIGVKGNTLSQLKGTGQIPGSEVNGRFVYPRQWLERLLAQNANAAGKAIEKELRDAA